MLRPKQIIKSKKIFSRNPTPGFRKFLFLSEKKLKGMSGVFSGKASTRQEHALLTMCRRAVDEGAGRCFPFVQVAQKLLANFVQRYHLTSSRIYAIIIIEVERNNEKK